MKFVENVGTADKRREGGREGGRASGQTGGDSRSVIKNIDDCMTNMIFPDLYVLFQMHFSQIEKAKQNKVNNKNNKNKKRKEMEK